MTLDSIVLANHGFLIGRYGTAECAAGRMASLWRLEVALAASFQKEWESRRRLVRRRLRSRDLTTCHPTAHGLRLVVMSAMRRDHFVKVAANKFSIAYHTVLSHYPHLRHVEHSTAHWTTESLTSRNIRPPAVSWKRSRLPSTPRSRDAEGSMSPHSRLVQLPDRQLQTLIINLYEVWCCFLCCSSIYPSSDCPPRLHSSFLSYNRGFFYKLDIKLFFLTYNTIRSETSE
ncbi:hypothetical protein J6590_016973 [Homalodisca vitripennis]|nr:hypothetical protein J6590_016973 [Homalodisca vitripennis]